MVTKNSFFNIDDPESLKNCAAFQYKLDDKWTPASTSDIESQLQRMKLNIEFNPEYKVMDNSNYDRCATYPG